MRTPDPAANNTQIVRYHLALPNLTADADLVQARELLQQHHFVVDRVAPGEAVVAAAGAEPDWPEIKKALEAAGFPVAHTTTVDES